MVDWECIQKSLPDDIAVKIASSLQVPTNSPFHFQFPFSSLFFHGVANLSELFFPLFLIKIFRWKLKASDLCALGSCSRFWRELCKADCLWESLAKERWPFQALLEENPSSSSSTATEIPLFQVNFTFFFFF